MTVQLSRRERRKQETRRALIDAALRLVIEHGIDGVTVDMIAEAADVSPRTFFNYFSSKDDALVCVDDFEGLLRAIEARPPGEAPLQAMHAAFGERAAMIGDNAAQWRMRVEVVDAHPALKARLVAGFEPLEQAMVEIIARRCQRDPASDLYPSLVCVAALSAARVALHRWLQGDCQEPITGFLDEAFAHLGRGLVPDLN
jgi:AcrR family transcriptional regulator